MKKFLFAAFAAISLILCMASCENVKPEFKFDLSLTGDVSNAPTAIMGNFDVTVCNDAVVFMDVKSSNAPVKSILEQEGLKANSWLDEYIQKNVISYFAEPTVYDVLVKGYVKESTTGLIFSVDKRFTNKSE